MLPYIQRKILAVQQSEYKESPRPPQFRVSSLPYCAILAIKETLEYDPDTPQVHPFSAGHYFKVGTAIHDNYQLTALTALPNELVGDFSCERVLETSESDNVITTKKCGRLVKFTTPNDLKNHPCPHRFNDCSVHQRYSELAFSYKGLSGHCDFLLRENTGKEAPLKKIKTKTKTGKKLKVSYKWHVADFKTTSPKLFEKYEEYVRKGYYPSKKYVEQIETYCVLIEHTYKIEISDYTIAYVCRSKPVHKPTDKAFQPFSYRWSPERRAYRQKRLKEQLKTNALYKKWVDDPSIENSKEIVKDRPCKCKSDYEEKMKHHFFGSENCEYLSKCMSGNKDIFSVLKSFSKEWLKKKKTNEPKVKPKIRKIKG